MTAGVGHHSWVSATEMDYRKSSQNKANVVATYLGGVGKLVEDKSVVDADVKVVLCKNFKAIMPPPDAGASTETTPSSAPASPTSTRATASRSLGKGGQQPPPADPTQC